MAINHVDALPPSYYEKAPADYSEHQAPLVERGNAHPEKQRIKPAVLHKQTRVKDVSRPYINVPCPTTECGGLKSDGYNGSLIRRQTFASERSGHVEEGALHQDQSSREPETNSPVLTVSVLIAQKLAERGKHLVDPMDVRKLVKSALRRSLVEPQGKDIHASSVIINEVKNSLRNGREARKERVKEMKRDERRSILNAKQIGLEVDVRALDMADLEEYGLDFEEEAAARYPQIAQEPEVEHKSAETLWTEEEIALLSEEAATRKEPKPLDPSLAWTGDSNLARKTAEYRGDIDYAAEEERENNRQVSTSPTWVV